MAKSATPRSASESDVGPEHTLTPERRLEAYRLMVLSRVTDERCLVLQRQGRIGFYVPLQGQEAAQVGAGLALRQGDWAFPAYRELGVALTIGVPLRSILDQLFANSEDVTKGRQMPNHFGFRSHHFVVASSPIGTQITQAVGAAMAAQRRRDPIVTIAFFGDGATSSNDFHAALNFAGVFKTPTIFFCQNNGWAISLPRAKQTLSPTLAEKALAYGFPGEVVDGNDLGAVYRAVGRARERALGGEGPTMIEAQVYRFGPHSTSDDPRRYRADAELEAAKQKDPVARMQKELRAENVLDEAADRAIWETAKAELAAALEAAEKAAPVDPMSFLDDVFGTPTPRLVEERAQFAELLRDGVVKP
jgi:pyruvate dehydrogenase E1 component alpha subunit